MIDEGTWIVYGIRIEKDKPEVLGERSSHYTCVHHKYNMDFLGIKPKLDL